MLKNKMLVEYLEYNNIDVEFMQGLKGGCYCNSCSIIENIMEAILDKNVTDDMDDIDIENFDSIEEIHNIEENTYINIFDSCRDCINDYSLKHYINYCDYHHELEISTNEFIEVGYNTYCYSSCGDAWSYCYNCEEPYDIDDLYFNENDGEFYCSDCYSNNCNEFIYDYHEWDGKFIPIGNSPNNVFLGFEIEVVTDNDINDTINAFIDTCNFKHFDWQKYFHIEHDGSLNNGVEFISQPLSFDIAYDVIPKMTNCLKLSNFSIDNSCGGHIHITKNDFTKKRIIDVLQFMQVNRDFILDYSKRNNDKFNRWSPFYNTNDMDALKNIALENVFSDRYHIINFNNWNTIEFRFFKGSLSHNKIFANMELIKALLFFNVNKTHNPFRIREIVDHDLNAFQHLDVYLSCYLDNPF